MSNQPLSVGAAGRFAAESGDRVWWSVWRAFWRALFYYAAWWYVRSKHLGCLGALYVPLMAPGGLPRRFPIPARRSCQFCWFRHWAWAAFARATAPYANPIIFLFLGRLYPGAWRCSAENLHRRYLRFANAAGPWVLNQKNSDFLPVS